MEFHVEQTLLGGVSCFGEHATPPPLSARRFNPTTLTAQPTFPCVIDRPRVISEDERGGREIFVFDNQLV